VALPQKFIDGLQPESHGIGINMIPGTPSTFQVELQRAPDNGGGSPGAFATIAHLGPLPAAAVYVDLLPNDGAYRHYRWRHIAPGYDPSANWSAVARGIPTRVEGAAAAGGLISIYPIVRSKPMSDGKYALKASDTVGKETDDDLFIATAKTVKVGTVASPSSITKTLRIHHAEFVPADQTSAWHYGNLQVQPGNLNFQSFWAPVVLPPGVTVTRLRMRAYRQTTGKIAEATLWKVVSDATSSLVTITHNTTGWQTKEGSLSQLVGGEAYTIELSLSAQGAGAGVDARLQYVELEYTMPDYSKGV